MPESFPSHLSMFRAAGLQVEPALAAIARRYIGANPPLPMAYRAYCMRGILRGKDFRYDADFNKIFPNARTGQFVYAWAHYHAETPIELKFDINCFGPLAVWLNERGVFQSTAEHESDPNRRHRITLPMHAGPNQIIVRCKKTDAGFGGIFGTWLGKHPYWFTMPPEAGPERTSHEGWAFTDPLDKEFPSFPPSNLRLHPDIRWTDDQLRHGQLRRIFGPQKNAYAVARAQAFFHHPAQATYDLHGSHNGSIAIFINSEQVHHAAGAGHFHKPISIPFGHHDIFVQSFADDADDWGFELQISHQGQAIPLLSPCAAEGTSGPWLFAGPFPEKTPIDLNALRDLNHLLQTTVGPSYWRIDLPDAFLRPYNDNALFGHWNYPLGVTLYGLLHAAKLLNSNETLDYIRRHIQSCCDTFHYALWDREQYGGATAIHTLLASIDSLDDCGSFASTMLEAAKHLPLSGYREIADYVADYISNKQPRLDDGTFFRKNLMHTLHENTMWADDLYMSVPFLCRYAQLTGESKYLDDAARQFVGFKKRLYIPNLKLMSHVYDFNRNSATGVSWGRGNGWTIFSLSELLPLLPQTHALRAELLEFFHDFCEGILRVQGDQGLWHQVLNHPDAYPETSCTAMFACAFSRGIRHGWLPNPAPYIDAVFRAWSGLLHHSIDRHANIHGVCRGSEYSFSADYYKNDLLPRLNDTHGIGIVLLAGVEIARLEIFLSPNSATVI